MWGGVSRLSVSEGLTGCDEEATGGSVTCWGCPIIEPKAL